MKLFNTANYTENFIQCILDSNGESIVGSTLVVGGDGRYFCKEATELIVRMCGANKVARLLVGQNGILSTPAVSSLIRHSKSLGKYLLVWMFNDCFSFTFNSFIVQNHLIEIDWHDK